MSVRGTNRVDLDSLRGVVRVNGEDASGATAVQIARKHRGVRTIVEHIGSAHDDAQLAALVQIARERITAGQLAFDLDALTPTTPTGVAPIVTGSRSRVLWEVLEGAYRRLGFAAVVDDDVFMKLVLARVVEPTSKADTVRVLGELGVADPGLRTIWRTLARRVEGDWRGKFATAAYTHATRHGQLMLVLYDVTTLYFEAEDEDDLRKVGMSKDRRVDPQIVVGMLVTADGFPIEVHEFTGNTAETLTLLRPCRSFDVERVHHRDRVGQLLGSGGLEPGEPVHRDDLDPLAPFLGPSGEPLLEHGLGTALEHVQQPCRARLVPGRGQVDDHRDVLVPEPRVPPDMLVDTGRRDVVEPVGISIRRRLPSARIAVGLEIGPRQRSLRANVRLPKTDLDLLPFNGIGRLRCRRWSASGSHLSVHRGPG